MQNLTEIINKVKKEITNLEPTVLSYFAILLVLTFFALFERITILFFILTLIIFSKLIVSLIWLMSSIEVKNKTLDLLLFILLTLLFAILLLIIRFYILSLLGIEKFPLFTSSF